MALSDLECDGKPDKTNQSINFDCVVIISTMERQDKTPCFESLTTRHEVTAFEEKYTQQPILLK